MVHSWPGAHWHYLALSIFTQSNLQAAISATEAISDETDWEMDKTKSTKQFRRLNFDELLGSGMAKF